MNTSTTPHSVRIARWAAGLQSAVLSFLCVLALVYAAEAHHSDAVAERAGNPNEYDGLGTDLGLIAAVLLAVPLLLVAIPLLLMRSHRTSARLTLIGTESLLMVPIVLRVPTFLLTDTDRSTAVPFVLWGALAVTTILALCSPSARAWTSPLSRSMLVPAHR